MHVVCPQCGNTLEQPRPTPEEVVCPSCGAAFRLEAGSTTGWDGPRRLGKFDLIDVLGSGAFGTVYLARDPELDRVVAIKVPRAGSLAGEKERDRFLREARSVAQLRHPSTVSVHEVGQADGVPFLVSEFVRGLTLADWLTGRRPAPAEAARLAAALAEALQYAHDKGVVHRDVKPSNVMLDEDGTPHLTDFGLAKREAGEATMTVEGQVLGTPAYMSPEQARGKAHEVDGRSDVYSLGVVLYEMLTGQLPFRGSPRMQLHQVLHDEPAPPRRLDRRVPRDLETVCLKAMAREPRRRYQTAAELADDPPGRGFCWPCPIRGRVTTRRPGAAWVRASAWPRRPRRRNPVRSGGCPGTGGWSPSCWARRRRTGCKSRNREGAMRRSQAGPVAVVLALAVLGAGRHQVAAAEEPVYKGRPVHAWLAALKDKDARFDGNVIDIVGEMGPAARAAVPLLIEALKDPEVHYRAANALGDIGPDAKAAVPALVALLAEREDTHLTHVGLALALIGEPAVPALLEALRSKNEALRASAARALGGIGRPAVVPLCVALWDRDPDVRGAAAYALEWAGPQAKDAVPLLILALADKESRVREAAAAALGAIGPDAKAAVEPLRAALTDRDGYTRLAAARALVRIRPEDLSPLVRILQDCRADGRHRLAAAHLLQSLRKQEALPALRAALTDEDSDVRRAALQALARLGDKGLPLLTGVLEDPRKPALDRVAAAAALREMGPEAKPAVPALGKALGDKDREVRSEAADALGKIGPAAKAAVPALAEALTDESRGVRATAAEALGAIGPGAKAAVPALLTAVSDEDDFVRGRVIEALGQIGPEARAAVGVLLAVLLDRDRRLAVGAAWSLGRIGEPAVGALLSGLHDRAASAREAAAFGLGVLGPKAKAAVAALIGALADTEPGVRQQAALALGRIVGEPLQAIGALVGRLKDPNEDVRTAAAFALGQFGPKARSAVTPLATALGDRSADVRGAAAFALGRIGPAARTAVAPLVGALKADRERRVRQVAAWALGQVAPEAETTLAPLGQALCDEDEAVRQSAVRSLGRLAAKEKQALDLLIDALRDRDPNVRGVAARALARLGPAAKAAVPALIRARNDRVAPWRSAARQTAYFGPLGPDLTTPSPGRLLQETDLDCQEEAAAALKQVDPEAARRAGVP